MPKELTLPSGKIAIIEKGKGKDLLQAQIKAKNYAKRINITIRKNCNH